MDSKNRPLICRLQTSISLCKPATWLAPVRWRWSWGGLSRPSPCWDLWLTPPRLSPWGKSSTATGSPPAGLGCRGWAAPSWDLPLLTSGKELGADTWREVGGCKGRRESTVRWRQNLWNNGSMFFLLLWLIPSNMYCHLTSEPLCPSTPLSPLWRTSRPSSQTGHVLGSLPADGSGSSRSGTATVQSLPPSDRKSPRPAMSTESGMWRK